MNLDELLKELRTPTNKITKIKDNVYLVETDKGALTILKTKRQQSKKTYADSHRFDNEVRIYKSLEAANLKHLNTPKLLSATDEAILIEYVEKCTKIEIKKVSDTDFVNAYIELQALKVKSKVLFDWKHQLLRGFFYQGVVVPLFSISKKLSFLKALQIVGLYFQLHFSNKKLNRHYWLHGDLTSSNVFYNKENDKLYFIDFENLFYTRKWILSEIIERCISIKEGQIHFDNTILLLYKQHATEFSDDLQKVNLKDQIRFSLLITCISNIIVTKSNEKRALFINFLEVVLNAKSFTNWFIANTDSVTEGNIAPSTLSESIT